MGVYIRGMDMPKSCRDCNLEYDNFYCHLAGKPIDIDRDDERLEGCPLTEVPEPHGDLIDRDKLKKSVLKWLPPDPCGVEEKERPFETDICVSMMMEIEEQTAVIEAEGGD